MGEYQIAGGDLRCGAAAGSWALASPNISTIQRQRLAVAVAECGVAVGELLGVSLREVDVAAARSARAPARG